MPARYIYGLTVLLYLILALHVLALSFSWYWIFWWFDILMHALGGIWVAGQSWWLYDRFRDKTRPISRKTVYGICLVSVLLIGVLWEVFEFSLDVFVIFQQNDVIDTVSDIGADVAGGLLAAVFISRIASRNAR